ncbi:methyltransferase domain-containing protein [Patescibacteria group bacterium]|nr:methyltransferase domain-containing protein [Patescibacteria group bacterium]
MQYKKAQTQLAKTVEDYNNISQEFNTTRQYSWKEFELFLPHIKGKSLADLGCGNGRFFKFIQEKKPELIYTGIDNSPALINYAKKQNPKANFQLGNLQNIPLTDNSQNTAVSIASFHHLPHPKMRQKALQEIHRILAKDGILIISVWNLFQPKYKKYIWQARLRTLLSLGQYHPRDTFIPWAKTGIKRYYYAFKEQELRNLLSKAGFKILESHIDRNILIICQKK